MAGTQAYACEIILKKEKPMFSPESIGVCTLGVLDYQMGPRL